MIIPLFDALNIVILICCVHFMLFGDDHAGILYALGIGIVGIAALSELMKSFTHPFFVDPVETMMLAGIAVVLLRMRLRAILKHHRRLHGTS